MTRASVLQQSEEKIVSSALNKSFLDKIIRVAKREPTIPGGFPHITKSGKYDYEYYPLDWWTSGFFPGSLWLIYERSMKSSLPYSKEELLRTATLWSHQLEPHKDTTTTHDLGFLIMPSYAREYDLTGDRHAGNVIVQAAKSLKTRWVESVQAFKSWDACITGAYEFSNPQSDTLVIIDNLMNLDLLFKASEISGDPVYAHLAVIHAETTAKYHVREDFSTYHLVVFDTKTGHRKVGLTHQGYQHESTWSRGQAWALYGFATVYQYTRDPKFLSLSKKIADYLISRTDDGIVYWDFDAPRPCAWDTSAAMVAVSGMLLICQLENNNDYLEPALRILEAVLSEAVAPADGDVILDKATVANYKYNKSSSTDHGLVYADYYLLEVGNRLIDMNAKGVNNKAN